MGALYHHITRPRGPREPFVPMNVNYGLMPPLGGRIPKRDRRRAFADRASTAFASWV